jgi:hypothetical protein
MAQAVSISLSKLTASVQAAVKAAVAKHPKFKVEVPNAVTVAYLIRGIPVPEAILANITVGETQAFAADIAQHIAGAHPEVMAQTAAAGAVQGAVISVGRHVVVGIPPVAQALHVEK